jgi:hypothetical protein
VTRRLKWNSECHAHDAIRSGLPEGDAMHSKRTASGLRPSGFSSDRWEFHSRFIIHQCGGSVLSRDDRRGAAARNTKRHEKNGESVRVSDRLGQRSGIVLIRFIGRIRNSSSSVIIPLPDLGRLHRKACRVPACARASGLYCRTVARIPGRTRPRPPGRSLLQTLIGSARVETTLERMTVAVMTPLSPPDFPPRNIQPGHTRQPQEIRS